MNKLKKQVQKDGKKEKEREKLYKNQKENKRPKINLLTDKIIQRPKILQKKLTKVLTETKSVNKIKNTDNILPKKYALRKLPTLKLKTGKVYEKNLLSNNNNLNNKSKGKKVQKIKNVKSFGNTEDFEYKELDLLLKKTNLKKAIIIDNEGNNNLNIYLKGGIKHEVKKLLSKQDILSSNSYNTDNEASSLFTSFNPSNIENYNLANLNLDNKVNNGDIHKQTILDKNEEEKRLKEYDTIFNLLNSNIEQFKNMFNNTKVINNINKKEKIIDNKIIIDKKIANKSLKKNLSEENLSFSRKYNINLEDIILSAIQSDRKEEGEKFSFMESSIQDDFYQVLTNKNIADNLSHSWDGTKTNVYSEAINQEEIINNNDTEEESAQDENVQKKLKNIIKMDNDNAQKEKDDESKKNNCLIF